MVSSRRKNYLQTIVDIQNIVLEHKGRGVTQKWVFDNIINTPDSPYHLGYTTFCRYMTINAK